MHLENYKNLTDKVIQHTTASTNSEQWYHKMIEEVEDYAILLLSTFGNIQNWNRGAEKIKGYKEEEIIGYHFRIFYPLEDQAKKLPEELLEQAKVNGKATNEGWRVRKDGSWFWGSVVITALHDKDGHIIGFSKVTRDLTERKNAEEQILAYTRQLERQNKELQQFAFAAAHDMKEPLRKIQLYNSAVLEDAHLNLTSGQQSYFKKTVDAATRMQALIEDLLTFAKITKINEQFEQVDLNVVLQDVLSSYSDAIQLLDAVVDMDDLPIIFGIPFQLRQLFSNLISNALKFHSTGRLIRIGISCETVKLAENNNLPAGLDCYTITVKDNGIGFDPKYGQKIFDMFERLHTYDRFPGTGIGLALCRKIVDNH